MTDQALQHLTRSDEILGQLIRRIGPCTLRPKLRRSPFEALIRSVIFQQLNGTAASAILARFKALYPNRRFPRPADLLATPDARLRRAGLSRAKMAALRDIARQTLAGVVPTRGSIQSMSDAEIIERLTTIRGVGPWTVEMVLIFTLGREDVLPAADFGVRKGVAVTYGWKELPSPKDLLAFGEKWRPHRTTAAWYFWRALDMPANW